MSRARQKPHQRAQAWRFSNKLDLVPLVLSKHLHAKTQFLAYDHDQGPPAAQHLVSKQQRRLAEFIDDAQEWADAKVEAMAETMTE